VKTLLPVCAGIAVISSIVSVYLWHELRDAGLANADLHRQLTEARTASRLSAQPAPVASIAASRQTAPTAAEAPVGKPEASAPKLARQADVVDLDSYAKIEKELMKNPEYQKLKVAQARMNIARNYPGLAEALGLSERDIGRLFDMLAENQVTQSQESVAFSGNSTPDPAAIEEMRRRQQQLQREQEESLRAMLGSKYTQPGHVDRHATGSGWRATE
jgi:hypothetical protein